MSTPALYVRGSKGLRKLKDVLKEKKGKVEKVVEKVDVEPPKSSRFATFAPPHQSDVSGLMLAQALCEGGKKARAVPARALQLPYKLASYSWNQMYMLGKPDKKNYVWMYRHVDVIQKYVDYAGETIMTNNTRRAQMVRLLKIMPYGGDEVNPVNPRVKRVAEMLPVYMEGELLAAASATDLLEDNLAFEEINTKSCAGMPYMMEVGNTETVSVDSVTRFKPLLAYNKPGEAVELEKTAVPILEHAFALARLIYHSVVLKAADIEELPHVLESFFARYPELNTCFAKRKLEILLREDWNEKVRTYFVTPLPMRLLCKFAWHPLEAGLQNYLQNRESVSMYHFNQFRGGATRLIKSLLVTLREVRKSGLGFKALCYGDDNLWFVVFADGTVLVVSLDVKAMDMNTRMGFAYRMLMWFAIAFPNHSEERLSAFFAAVYVSFKKDVLLGGSSIVTMNNGWISGVPGTTVGNIHSSACMAAAAEESVRDARPHDKPGTVIANAIRAVTDDTKFTFKTAPEAFEGKSFDDLKHVTFQDVVAVTSADGIEQTGITVPFLGNKIVAIEKHPFGKRYCSIPLEPAKFGASLVNVYGAMDAVVTMQRCLGIAFSGGWYEQEFYEVLAKIHDAAANSIPDDLEHAFTEVEFQEVGGADNFTTALKEAGLSTKKGFPERDFFEDFNILEEDEFKTRWYPARREAVHVPKPEKKAVMSDFFTVLKGLKVSDAVVKEAARTIGVDQPKKVKAMMAPAVSPAAYLVKDLGTRARSIQYKKARLDRLKQQKRDFEYVGQMRKRAGVFGIELKGMNRQEVEASFKQYFQENTDEADQAAESYIQTRVDVELDKLENSEEFLRIKQQQEDDAYLYEPSDDEDFDKEYAKSEFGKAEYGR